MTKIIAIIAIIPLFFLGLSASLLIVAFVEWWSRERPMTPTHTERSQKHE